MSFCKAARARHSQTLSLKNEEARKNWERRHAAEARATLTEQQLKGTVERLDAAEKSVAVATLAGEVASARRAVGSRDGSCRRTFICQLIEPPRCATRPPPPRACAAPRVLSPSASGRPRGRARARAAPVEGQPAGPPGAGCGRGGLGSALARVPQRLGAGPAASPTGLGAGFAAPDGATAREGEAPGAFWV